MGFLKPLALPSGERGISISTTDLSSEILQRVSQIMERITLVEKKVERGQSFLQILDDGLRAYRQELVNQTPVSESRILLNGWFEKLRTDTMLRFPHRKILETLLGQYDFTKNKFRELHFSKLVKEARVGKNVAKIYLSFLEDKGYIQKRDDGYRKFFKIRQR